MTKYLPKSEFTENINLTSFDLRLAIRTAPKNFLTSTQKLVLLMIISRGEGDNPSFPSLETLANDTGLTSRCVSKEVLKLEKSGWLKIAHGGPNQSNEYAVLVPGCVQRTVEKSAKGNQYFKFIFPAEPSELSSLPDVADDRGTEPGSVGTEPGSVGVPNVVPQGTERRSVEEVNISKKAEERNEEITEPGSLADARSQALVAKDLDSEGLGLSQGFLTPETQARGEDNVPPPPVPDSDSGKIKYWFSKEKNTYHRAGRSKPRPGETELWLTEDEYDRAMGWNGKEDHEFMKQIIPEPSFAESVHIRQLPRQRPSRDDLLATVRQNELETTNQITNQDIRGYF